MAMGPLLSAPRPKGILVDTHIHLFDPDKFARLCSPRTASAVICPGVGHRNQWIAKEGWQGVPETEKRFDHAPCRSEDASVPPQASWGPDIWRCQIAVSLCLLNPLVSTERWSSPSAIQ